MTQSLNFRKVCPAVIDKFFLDDIALRKFPKHKGCIVLSILKRKILRTLAVRGGVQAPSNFHVGPGSVVSAPRHLKIGENTYIGKNCTVQINGQIGNGVLIANNVGIVGRLDHEWRETGVFVRDGKWVGDDASLANDPRNKIHIEDDVWIGFGSIILGGIRIGEGAIIAAGSVVTKNVDPYCVVAGSPAKRVGDRFDGSEEQKQLHHKALQERYQMSQTPHRAKVAYAFPTSHRFRAPFHNLLKAELEAKGIDYDYIYADSDDNFGKKDTIAIPWATSTPLKIIKILGKNLYFHHLGPKARAADLLILQQQNNLLSNYSFQILRRFRKKKIAFFGHGKNFQAVSDNSSAERFKRFWAKRVHWWFTYTDGCKSLIADYGFPDERITVFNNSVDLTTITKEISAVSAEKLDQLRQAMFGGSENVAVYVGGLYKEKRVPFLLQAVHELRRRIPDFHFVVMGGGPDAHLIVEAAKDAPWIHYCGSMFGQEKTELVLTSKVWLMPGLVGLAVLDSFAYGTPMVTTDQPFHSPEIEYLESGKNGVMVQDASSLTAYADAVENLLTNEDQRAALVTGAQAALERFSIEKMAKLFADGIEKALQAPLR